MTTPLTVLRKKRLEITVFLCGAVVMIFELVGSRVLGPYLGSSIYVWTSLIGVILASLSFGYWLGGRRSEYHADDNSLAFIIFLAGCLSGLTILLKDFVPSLFYRSQSGIEISSMIVSLILFAPTSIALGMVSPYAVRLRTVSIETSGRSAGNLYALSTLGSIVGTFAAGYWLIPFLGTANILLSITGTLLLLSLWQASQPLRFLRRYGILSLTIIGITVYYHQQTIAARKQANLIDIDTPYNRIMIYEGTDRKTGQPTINLITDPYGIQSAIFKNSDELVFSYTKAFRTSENFAANTKDVLMIGGCGFTYANDLLSRRPETKLDVIEIDPGMTEAAKKYFRLKDNSRLSIFHEDGRTFLNRNDKQYDIIFVDAFGSFLTIPYQLTTQETAEREFLSLRDNGIVVVNIISPIAGEKARFLNAMVATYRSVFPEVNVFQADPTRTTDSLQNLLLVASKQPLPTTQTALGPSRTELIDPGIVLSDNYAPVDYLRYTAS